MSLPELLAVILAGCLAISAVDNLRRIAVALEARHLDDVRRRALAAAADRLRAEALDLADAGEPGDAGSVSLGLLAAATRIEAWNR